MVDVALQANDYEIERSGKLPNRERMIPRKFRDYENSLAIKDKDNDEDYIPKHHTTSHQTGRKGFMKRKPGRPTKSSHFPSEMNGQQYRCNTCRKKFTNQGEFDEHLILCDYEGCRRSYCVKSALRRHQISQHGLKHYICNICNRHFSTNQSLKEHMSRHFNSKLYSCPDCGKEFRQASCLFRHQMGLHSNEKRHICEICGKAFALTSYLKSHKRTHTGEKSFKCDQCGKMFGYRSDLNRHKIIHSGRKPFECSVCQMRFSDASSCRRHQKYHTDDKTNKCNLCGIQYKKATQLQTHIQKTHMNYLSVETVPPNDATETVESSVDLQHVHDQIQQLLMSHNTEELNIHIVLSDGDDSRSVIDQFQLATEKLRAQIDEGTVCNPLLVNGAKTDILNVQFNSAGEQTPLNELKDLGQSSASKSIIQSDFTVQDTKLCSAPSNGEVLYLEKSNMKTLLTEVVKNSTDLRETGANLACDRIKQSLRKVPSEKLLESTNFEISNCQTTKSSISNNVYAITSTRKTSTDSRLVNSQNIDPNSSSHSNDNAENNSCSANADHDLEKSSIFYSYYITEPDFSSQDYFNWLAIFVESCKVLQSPLKVDIYQKVNSVVKKLTDAMACPNKVLSNKDNFSILMSISQDLNTVIVRHLDFVYSQLSND